MRYPASRTRRQKSTSLKATAKASSYAQLTHYESKSRGGDEKDPVKARRFAAEQQRLYAVHGKANILHDPYYNPNLTMDREDFSESDDLRGLKEGRITVQWRE